MEGYFAGERTGTRSLSELLDYLGWDKR